MSKRRRFWSELRMGMGMEMWLWMRMRGIASANERIDMRDISNNLLAVISANLYRGATFVALRRSVSDWHNSRCRCTTKFASRFE